jgi:hypothetical protein
MRQFCLLICISLFSMFQVAALSAETLQPLTIETLGTNENNGFSEEAAATDSKVLTSACGTELFNPVLSTLMVQEHPNRQFKPPRLFLLC